MEARRNWYSILTIADVLDMKPATVRKHRAEGKFDFDDHMSVARYMVSVDLGRMAGAAREQGEEE